MTYWYWILWVELKGDWQCVSILHTAAKRSFRFPKFFSMVSFLILIYISNCRTYDVDTMQIVISFQILNICLFFGLKRLNLLLGSKSVTNWKRKIEFCNKQGLQPIPPRVNLSNWIVYMMSNTKLITTIAKAKTKTMLTKGAARTPGKFRERT